MIFTLIDMVASFTLGMFVMWIIGVVNNSFKGSEEE